MRSGIRIKTEALASALVARWSASGLSRRVFCRRQGISLGSFEAWRRRLEPGGVGRTESIESSTQGRSRSNPSRSELIEVVVAEVEGDVGIEVMPKTGDSRTDPYEVVLAPDLLVRIPRSAGAAELLSFILEVRRHRC